MTTYHTAIKMKCTFVDWTILQIQLLNNTLQGSKGKA